MIRWRFVLSRLIVILAVVMLLRWGLGPVANYLTILAIQGATGAKVDIAKTRVGLFPPRVQYVGLQIADPRADKELRDLFRADLVDLVIDGESLMHRRWVIREGKITGLQIGSRRDAIGHLEQQPEPEKPTRSAGSTVLNQLIGVGISHITAQTKAYAENLETVNRSQQIRDRWEAEYDRLVTRARGLEKQVRTIRDEARGIDNPLRDWPALERTLAKANQARNELVSVRESIDSLPQRMQADLVELDEARRMDLASVDRFVPGNLSEGGEFGVDIMASAVRDQIDRVRGFVDGGRTVANYTVVAPKAERVRGTNFDLNPIKRPDVLLRRCEVAGIMRADGKVYAMTGILDNLSPSPELLAEPSRARLRLEGPEVIRVEYVRDRRDHRDVDLVTLHWPQVTARPMRLGDQDDLGIIINGGQRELWVQIRTDRDQIEGRLVSKQTGVKMDLNVDSKYADTAGVVALRNSLASVDRIEVDAQFEGTWRDIDLDLNTNLGQILGRAARDAVDGQVRDAKLQLAAKIEEAHREKTQELQEWIGSRQNEARELLASADRSIEEMSQKVLSEVGDADAYLGKLQNSIRRKLK